jgi:hypothetical protein
MWGLLLCVVMRQRPGQNTGRHISVPALPQHPFTCVEPTATACSLYLRSSIADALSCIAAS